MLTILVLCTGNSCRSIMAEGLLNHYGQGKIIAFSAGSSPTGSVNPLSLVTMARNGIKTSGYFSKSLDEYQNHKIDVVITVCHNAAGEVCPIFKGNPIKLHWDISDPACFVGTEDEIDTEFQRVFSELKSRVIDFFASKIYSEFNTICN